MRIVNLQALRFHIRARFGLLFATSIFSKIYLINILPYIFNISVLVFFFNRFKQAHQTWRPPNIVSRV